LITMTKNCSPFFERMFNAYIRRFVIEIDGHVYKVRYKCPRGFFGYEMADGEVLETD
jgi:hypothetical protein